MSFCQHYQKASHNHAKVERIICEYFIAATELLNSGPKNEHNVAPTALLPGGSSFRSIVDGLVDPVEAPERIFQVMRNVLSSDSIKIKSSVKRPNAQTYCTVL